MCPGLSRKPLGQRVTVASPTPDPESPLRDGAGASSGRCYSREPAQSCPFAAGLTDSQVLQLERYRFSNLNLRL
ncbi:hypothetical protein H920_01144 [Fukomys damarensis]|uniref:Uncharacterized protein n=1 Tax=Fukomys damarensis TaxID=885580 RepID=A0A091E4E1_FUKDA|nr:hypothetical protein H920_01144 [Fukomys damarensis]